MYACTHVCDEIVDEDGGQECRIVVTVFQEEKKERKEVKRVKIYMYK